MHPTTSIPVPQFYRFVTPLISRLHRRLSYEAPVQPDYQFAARANLAALTVDEFPIALTEFPIVFSKAEDSLPMALLGDPKVAHNQFVNPDGNWREGGYIPAVIRRYPFLLARLDDDADEASLCFDGACTWLRAQDEGNLFNAEDEATPTTQAILDFCRRFETAVRRTHAFVEELREFELLVDLRIGGDADGNGAVSLPGFQMVDEERLRQLRAEQLRRLMLSGSQGRIFAHLFSLRHLNHLALAPAVQSPAVL